MAVEIPLPERECPFCSVVPERVFLENEWVIGLWDAYPVSPGHALLVTRRHVVTWFDASAEEQAALTAAIGHTRDAIERRYTPEGYNVGFNAGAVAGQTVFHFHLHVIPRYTGDVPVPHGGIRGVIPGKAAY